MQVSGRLIKMKVAQGEQVQYYLRTGNELTHLNPFIGKKVTLSFTGVIECIVCGRKTKKSFGQGLCYPCFMNAPENSDCIVKPELCRGHLGEGRDPEWEKQNHVQPHLVYLALSSDVKVGVTRQTQVPTRWIDQGASRAIILAEVPYRQLAGAIEVELKKVMPDKTNWQRMLKNVIAQDVSLAERKSLAAAYLPEELRTYVVEGNEIESFVYPVLQYPQKVVSRNFDKTPVVDGVLAGIKGQYLIFDGGSVLNIRNMSGYCIDFSAD